MFYFTCNQPITACTCRPSLVIDGQSKLVHLFKSSALPFFKTSLLGTRPNLEFFRKIWPVNQKMVGRQQVRLAHKNSATTVLKSSLFGDPA